TLRRRPRAGRCVIDGTFAFVRGVGPARERELAAKGILSWGDMPPTGVVLSTAIDGRLREGIEDFKQLVAAKRWEEIAARLPVREHWRFFPHLDREITY